MNGEEGVGVASGWEMHCAAVLGPSAVGVLEVVGASERAELGSLLDKASKRLNGAIERGAFSREATVLPLSCWPHAPSGAIRVGSGLN